jgi:hypothetical protein
VASACAVHCLLRSGARRHATQAWDPVVSSGAPATRKNNVADRIEAGCRCRATQRASWVSSRSTGGGKALIDQGHIGELLPMLCWLQFQRIHPQEQQVHTAMPACEGPAPTHALFAARHPLHERIPPTPSCLGAWARGARSPPFFCFVHCALPAPRLGFTTSGGCSSSRRVTPPTAKEQRGSTREEPEENRHRAPDRAPVSAAPLLGRVHCAQAVPTTKTAHQRQNTCRRQDQADGVERVAQECRMKAV